MKSIQRKLGSRAGASMIMALIFLMFCTFIGSTVLVSATANGQRVAQLAEQQEYLTERSTALVLTDELQLEDDELLWMDVIDAVHSYQEMTVGDGGVFEATEREAVKRRVITFQVTTTDRDITPLQRLMLENTVWRYLRENAVEATYTLQFKDFPQSSGAEAVTGTDKFWFQYTPGAGENAYRIQGEMSVAASNMTSSGVELPSYSVHFSTGRGADIYDFFMDFGDLSQLKVTVNAFSNVEVQPPRTDAVTETTDTTLSATGYVQDTVNSTVTTISWNDPMIEKGGAPFEAVPAETEE